MFRRFWAPVFAAALALFLMGLGTAPTTVYAASKQEQMLQELQRDVAQLQDTVKGLQRSQDEKFAALQVLVQQSVNVANDANKSVAVIQSSLQQTLRDQEGKVVAPVVGLSTHMDSMSNDFRGLQNSVSDLTALINKMQTQLSDIRDTLKVMQAPPPAPPPPVGTATEGGAGAAAASAPERLRARMYSSTFAWLWSVNSVKPRTSAKKIVISRRPPPSASRSIPRLSMRSWKNFMSSPQCSSASLMMRLIKASANVILSWRS